MDSQTKTPIVLVILDGWGFSNKKIGNPIASSAKPIIDMLAQQYPMALLQASGLAVGMTWGEAGNSEVGHLNIGAGRIVEQYLSRINRGIRDGSFFSNNALVGAFDHASKNNSRIHLIGLLTSGTAHADFSHIIALLELAKQKGWGETFLHLFLDGRDSGLQESPILLEKLKKEIDSVGYGKIATLIGRNFAMDRDNNWELTRKAYELLANGIGEASADYLLTIQGYYDAGEADPSIPPITNSNVGFTGISAGDSLIFFNFREDSMRQILKVFVEQDFSLFSRKSLTNNYICTMTQYLDNDLLKVAYALPSIPNTLSEALEIAGKRQLHMAETEKYAHVTYFFNGLKTTSPNGEVDIFIDSDKDIKKNPAMKSLEMANKVVEELGRGLYDFMVINFANADMLAHNGNYEDVVAGIKAIDEALGVILAKSIELNGILIVTADHGNAESLVYRGSGEPETRHDDNPAPIYLVANQYKSQKTSEQIARETGEATGILADIAPTILELMGLPQPIEMTGKSLLPLLTASD